jgi:hypothetical protein
MPSLRVSSSSLDASRCVEHSGRFRREAGCTRHASASRSAPCSGLPLHSAPKKPSLVSRPSDLRNAESRRRASKWSWQRPTSAHPAKSSVSRHEWRRAELDGAWVPYAALCPKVALLVSGVGSNGSYRRLGLRRQEDHSSISVWLPWLCRIFPGHLAAAQMPSLAGGVPAIGRVGFLD